MTSSSTPTTTDTTLNSHSAANHGAFPLTFAQESLFFLQQLTRGEPVYNMPKAFRLRGELNQEALRKSLALLLDRHHALRTQIRDSSNEPIQIVSPKTAPCFRTHDLQSSPNREQTLKEALQTAICEPFDLSNGPLFRADLFLLGPGENVLLLNLHHIVGDIESLGVIYQELSATYEAISRGAQPNLPLKPVQLGWIAAEMRRREISSDTCAFWRQSLQHYTGELGLATDRFRPNYPSFRGNAYYFDLEPTLRAKLSELARKNKTSVYMLCLAALEVLLHRYSDQERFTIATPFSERDDPSLEHTVGYLISLLPIPCDVRPNTTFRELLSQVRSQCLEVYAHHAISFRRILQELGISSDNPKPPLARVVFQYFPEIPTLQLSGLDCDPIRVHSATSKFDLCISMAEEGNSITTEIEYDTDLFDPSSIQRLARHFRTLLAAIADNPDENVSSLPLTDLDEKEALEQWPGIATAYPRDKTVPELFEEQVLRAPDNIALRFENQQISYDSLNRHANQIAWHLSALGVKQGDFVGVCLERSPDLIAALIGILKVGAAFVPFEATYPRARLDYLFQDSAVRVLVTKSSHAQIAPEHTQTILLDQLASLPTPQGSENLPKSSSATSVAYMMYTSGSTGNPKGAMIPHRAIIRLVRNNNFASFDKNEVFLAFAPISFDASTLEIWGPLLNGATLAIYPPTFESIEQFEEILARHKVTTLWLTAGLFNTIVDRNVKSLRGIRQLLVGGDVLSVAHIRKAIAALPNTKLINGYGPTENTTFTCCYRIPQDLPADRSIPIGRPINNSSVYILDQRLQKVPIGVPGDLYTGGDGLSLGYWNKPELTAQSFIANPFQPGAKLYKTGDRARWLADGTIEFLGRRDTQIKIRGFRIEIEEIEGAFRKIPAVQDVAVVAHADQSGGKNLVAYLVQKPNRRSNPGDILSTVSRFVPPHAVPSRIVFIDSLPLGPNGKVNRSALPPPANLAGVTDLEIAAPNNEIEAKLLILWQQILEIAALSIDDNFFHLGGESLRATRALSQINATFNTRLTLPRLFEAPTVRQMARLIQSSTNDRSESPIVSRSPAHSSQPPDLSHLSEQDIDKLLSQLLSADESSKS